MKARIYVTLKRAVLDPQGATVARSLGQLGFDEVEGVRVGKLIEVELGVSDTSRARQRLGEMCEKLLANPIIEEYRIELEDKAR